MKAVLRASYIHVDLKHLSLCLREFEGRYNTRYLGDLEIMRLLARGMMGKKLGYRELTEAERN